MLSGHVPSDKQDNERGEFQRADIQISALPSLGGAWCISAG